MNWTVLPPLLLVNAAASLLVGFLIGLLTGWRPGGSSGFWDDWGLAVLIAGFAWASSSLVAPLWYRMRRHARWNYLEGLAWGLLAYLLAAVPFLAIFLSQNGRMGMGVLEWFGLATLLSSPALLLVAPFVTLFWKRVVDRAEGRP